MHHVSITFFKEIPAPEVFLRKIDTFAALILPQNVPIFTRVPFVILKKQNFLEILYINEIGSPDQVHCVSIKILEIRLF